MASGSDITIICPNQRQLLCHRAVLASRSKRLAAVFQSGDYTGQHLPVSGVDSAALEAVVSSFYTGECPVSLETVVAVHDAANKLEVPDLLQSCMAYIQQAVSLGNVCTLYSQAHALKDGPVLELCKQYILPRCTDFINSHDFHKQPYEVASALLADFLQSGMQLMMVLQVAAGWLSRQPNRDVLKMPLLQAIGAPHGAGPTLDGMLQTMSMTMHNGMMLSSGGALIDTSGTPGRLSMGNLVLQPNMNPRDSMNGARLLPGPGMPMAGMPMGGGLESPLGMGNNMFSMNQNGMMQSHGGAMYPGMQPVLMQGPEGQQMYMQAGADGNMMYGVGSEQMVPMNVNGQTVFVPGSSVQQLQQQGGIPRGSPQNADGSPAKGRAGRLTSPPGKAGRGGKPGKGGRGTGSGRRAGGAGNGEGSEDDHSEATRSMPTGNELSDGERASSAAAAAGGAPPNRPSWYGGDGVLALAEAAEAAEQKIKVPRKVEDGAPGTPQHALAAAGRVAELVAGEQPTHSNNSSRRRGAAADGADDALNGAHATPESVKRARTNGSPAVNLNGSDLQASLNALTAGNNGNNGSYSSQQLNALSTLTNLTSTGPLGAGSGLGGLGSFDLSALGGGGGLEAAAAGLGLMPGNFLSTLTNINAGALTGLLEGTAVKLEDNQPKSATKDSGRGKGRAGGQPQKGFCHVDNCNADLTGLRDYHQRYKICDTHLKAPSIMRDGIPQRFCQQCGRFHTLEQFDGTRRSCRQMLQRHNARRNKRNPEAAAAASQPLNSLAGDAARNPLSYLSQLGQASLNLQALNPLGLGSQVSALAAAVGAQSSLTDTITSLLGGAGIPQSLLDSANVQQLASVLGAAVNAGAGAGAAAAPASNAPAAGQ